ncbi:unnamed protein product, partial [Ascophyllum nodosum]
VGFDIEWDIALSGAHENPPATFQLAAGKFVFVLQILHGQKTPPTELSGSLVGLLEDASLTFTGVGISADCTRIENFFGVKVAHAVDLAKLALIRKVPLGLKRGLADLCSHLLGRSLSKDGRVRLSRWNLKDLSEEQKTYAALDAYVSTVLYFCIEEKSDPIFKEGEDLQAGDHVRLYT